MTTPITDPPKFSQGNEFSKFYLDLEKNRNLKRKIVHEDPELAQRIFYVFGDKEIGKMFVKHYQKNQSYIHSAYFVAVECGIEVEREKDGQYEFYSAPHEIRDIVYENNLRGMGVLRSNKHRRFKEN